MRTTFLVLRHEPVGVNDGGDAEHVLGVTQDLLDVFGAQGLRRLLLQVERRRLRGIRLDALHRRVHGFDHRPSQASKAADYLLSFVPDTAAAAETMMCGHEAA
jgi:hypothetical protein